MNINDNYLKKLWLLVFCLLVILMISVGGITRLTRSGLSIVEWRPITGIIPPLTEQEWISQFELYKSSPEFNQVNSHFEVNDYKNIFLWEYSHRLLGRIIFLFAFLPGIFLWKKNLISLKFVLQLSTLIAFQGLIGWLMVKTGLNKNPYVSPYMLALHLFSALAVLLFAFYQLFKIDNPTQIFLSTIQYKIINLIGVLIGLQIFYGCLTSGLKAGYGYNTYPLMNGDFFPADGFFFKPLWINFFENTSTVQWVHRWLGLSVFLLIILLTILLFKSSLWTKIKKQIYYLLTTTIIQVALGILNIIYVVPIPLAVLHQFTACILVLFYFRIIFQTSK